jgi:hypothetical protein
MATAYLARPGRDVTDPSGRHPGGRVRGQKWGVDLVASARPVPRSDQSAIRSGIPLAPKGGIAGERTGERRNGAPANGVKFGRKRKLSDYQRTEAVERRDAGETLAAIAKSDGVDLSMISRL